MQKDFKRREFIKGMSTVAAAGMVSACGPSTSLPNPSAARLPRWRGFNLLEKFIARSENAPFRESDFEWMAEWGFDFVRLPMSYHCWSSPENWREISEPVLEEIDQAVEFGRQYGVHVSINFHRAPGYSVDRAQEEPFNLWLDEEALEACAHHWRHFAKRYSGIANSALSFDLVNEPAIKSWETNERLDDLTYLKVARVLVDAIRSESPDRLIIADGLMWGRIPVPALNELGIAQSTRGYDPMQVSHWKASWVGGSDQWPEPTWPLPTSPEQAAGYRRDMAEYKEVFVENPIIQEADVSGRVMDWNRERIDWQLIQPWKQLEAMGVGVHVGEFGCFNHTPHDVALAWLGDLFDAWKSAGWGWGMWNFRGPFGILDSGRTDVKYENFRGHQLDRAMLEMLREN